MIDQNVVHTDFLIVGGGPAGCMAAIRARKMNPKINVTILEKAEISRSGAAGRGMDALNNVVVPGISTVEEYIESVEIMVDGVFNADISRVIAERSFSILQRLESWGVTFPKDKDENYIVNQFHPKGRFMVEMRGELKKIIAKKTITTGTKIFNLHPVVDLIKDGDSIGGAIAIDLESGKLRAFVAPAVLLCAGGAARIGLSNTGYLHGTFDCPWCNGEAWKMGYEAGASLTGFEYTEQSSMIRDFNGAGQSTFIRHGAWLVNGLGERFMERYDSNRMEHAPAGIRARAITSEEQAGRGPVAFSFSHLPSKTIALIEDALFDTERPTIRDYFKNKGIDMRKDPIEIVMTEVYLCGGHGLAGLVSDAWGETRVPGLFAAGDCLANPYGFLAGAMCMGEAAAERVSQRKFLPPESPDTDKRMEKLEALIKSHREGRLRVTIREFEYKFRRLVNEYVAPPKSERKLKRFLNETESMIHDQDDLPAVDPHQLMKVFEVKAGLFCARMAARASLFREESRFGLYHERVDFPEKDNKNWKTRIFITAGTHGPLLVKERP